MNSCEIIELTYDMMLNEQMGLDYDVAGYLTHLYYSDCSNKCIDVNYCNSDGITIVAKGNANDEGGYDVDDTNQNGLENVEQHKKESTSSIDPIKKDI